MLDQQSEDELEAGTGFMVSMRDCLQRLQGRGYTTNIVACFDHFEANSGKVSLFPADFSVDGLYRVEYSSDPDDQAVIYAISSRDLTVKGAYVEAYGIYQDELSAPMIERLKRHRQ